MRLTLITAPAGEPVSIGEAKTWCRIDADLVADDGLLTSLITTVRQMLDAPDGWLGRALMRQTWDVKLDGFPCGEIRLPLPPTASVTHVKYYDTANAEQTWSSSLYELDSVSEPARLRPISGEVWPSTYDRLNAVTVRIVTGYADAESIPEPIKVAIKAWVAHLYAHRGEVGAEPPAYVQMLMANYRIWPGTTS